MFDPQTNDQLLFNKIFLFSRDLCKVEGKQGKLPFHIMAHSTDIMWEGNFCITFNDSLS